MYESGSIAASDAFEVTPTWSAKVPNFDFTTLQLRPKPALAAMSTATGVDIDCTSSAVGFAGAYQRAVGAGANVAIAKTFKPSMCLTCGGAPVSVCVCVCVCVCACACVCVCAVFVVVVIVVFVQSIIYFL